MKINLILNTKISFLVDYLKTLVSLGVSTVAHIIQMIPALLPYLVFLGTFGLFVLWNGSVVLGRPTSLTYDP